MTPSQEIDRPLETEACQPSNEPDTTAPVQPCTAAEPSEADTEPNMGQYQSVASSKHLLKQNAELQNTILMKSKQISQLSTFGRSSKTVLTGTNR